MPSITVKRLLKTKGTRYPCLFVATGTADEKVIVLPLKTQWIQFCQFYSCLRLSISHITAVLMSKLDDDEPQRGLIRALISFKVFDNCKVCPKKI